MSKAIDLDAAIAAIMGEPSEVRYPAYYAEQLKKLPCVSQEMSAVEYIYISNRMLKGDYRAWDRLMVFEENDDANKAIAWMEEWAKEHPEKLEKTY